MLKMIALKWYGNENYDGIEVATVPAKPGVYKIHSKLDNGEWRVVYVGQAANLNQALRLHLQPLEPNEKLRDYVLKYYCGFSYAFVEDAQVRNQIVRGLYKEFEPELNPPLNVEGPEVQIVNL